MQFSGDKDSVIKTALDRKRIKEEEVWRNMVDSHVAPATVDLKFDGHGILFVAIESLHSSVPLCMGLGSKSNKVCQIL